MDRQSFQRQILSQIGPIDLITALLAYERDSGKATKQAVYFLSSRHLHSAEEATALLLLQQLLAEAAIPQEILNIHKVNLPESINISDATWQYFYSYRFSGKIHTNFQLPDQGLAIEGIPLFMIEAEDAIIDVLSKPINMLLEFIENISRIWQHAKESGIQTYYLPKMHSSLFIYIEAHVAGYYGCKDPFKVGISDGKSSVFNGYRFIGMINEHPIMEVFQEVCQKMALLQATSTIL